jgi:hypothetical protein
MPRSVHRAAGLAATAVACLSCLGMADAAGAAPVTGAGSQRHADFNGDGADDLVVGVEGEDLATPQGVIVDAGAVVVQYGERHGILAPQTGGLKAAGSQFIFQGGPIQGGTVPELAETGDRFGAAIAADDFDGDGFGDVAIGAPFEDVDVKGDRPVSDAGLVVVLYGSPQGLAAAGGQAWTQNSEDTAGEILDQAEPNDHFGAALAGGDFDDDTFDDLGAGAPDEDLEVGDRPLTNAGRVHAIYGAASGLGIDENQVWDQDQPDVADAAESGDRFGAALAAGDFDLSQTAELAIGAPEETAGLGTTHDGAVNVIYGRVLEGLAATDATGNVDNQIWFGGQTDAAGTVEAEAQNDAGFGAALAATDGRLAIGIPAYLPDPLVGAESGAVEVLYGRRLPGTADGLQTDGNQLWFPGQSDAAGTLQGSLADGGAFGSALAWGEFAGDEGMDLAIGYPGDGIVDASGSPQDEAGAVLVLYSVDGKLTTKRNELLAQELSKAQTADGSEFGDRFGSALVAGDFNRRGDFNRDDLAVGVAETVNPPGGSPVPAAGAVDVLYGRTPLVGFGGLNGRVDLWHQGVAGLAGDGAEADDGFGVPVG